MNLNQFTQKSVEAVQAAQQMASARQNQQIEQEHLLLALLEQKEGLIPQLMQKAGVEPYTAVIEATVSRARPVLMAALTTVFGLSFATLLTLFVTPALYTVFYKISKRGE